MKKAVQVLTVSAALLGLAAMFAGIIGGDAVLGFGGAAWLVVGGCAAILTAPQDMER